jgi:hypothetical protein
MRIDSRADAALQLGVSEDADEASIRRAWRVWARLAHPDVGGDAEAFDRLRRARDVLLAQMPLPPAPPRPRLRDVIRRPGDRHVLLLALTAAAAVLLVGLPLLAVDSARFATLAPASLVAAIAAVLAARFVLDPCADAGHRIAFVTCVWLPLVAVQVVVAEVIGASALTVLPLMALPFVAVIAAVNPGAGLVR